MIYHTLLLLIVAFCPASFVFRIPFRQLRTVMMGHTAFASNR
jgi:hypothetical protein